MATPPPQVVAGDEAKHTWVADGKTLAEKVGELEARAKRLAQEEMEELLRGRDLNIIAGFTTPMKTPARDDAAAAPPPVVAATKMEPPDA